MLRSIKEILPPPYKNVLLHFDNGLIIDGYITEDHEAVINQNAMLKIINGNNPNVVYWDELPEYPENKKEGEN